MSPKSDWFGESRSWPPVMPPRLESSNWLVIAETSRNDGRSP